MKIFNKLEVLRNTYNNRRYITTVRLRLKNTEQNLTLIDELKKKMKEKQIRIRIRCRHHNRKELFKRFNKYYNTIRGGSSNDINFNSQLSKFSDEFVLYFFKIEKQKYSDTQQEYISLEYFKDESDVLFVKKTIKSMFN